MRRTDERTTTGGSATVHPGKRRGARAGIGVAAPALAAFALAASGCAARTPAAPTVGGSPATVAASAHTHAGEHPADRRYTEADIRFMSQMIAHHGQAIEMSRMAPTHGANPTIRTLAARIINGQQDEIAIMQRWLRNRGQPVPEPRPTIVDHAAHGVNHALHGGEHTMHGMLTEAQMKELDAARGPEFDRLFLTFMIQHHKGAITMVEEVFAAGAAQDDTVFRLASDVNAEQTSEIARMQRLLFDLIVGKSPQ